MKRKEKNTVSPNQSIPSCNILWAILFACGNSVFFNELSDKLNISAEDIVSSVEELKERLKDTPLMLIETENSFKLVTKPDYAEYIRKFLYSQPQKLTEAAMETLAIIISKQPCTRQEIEEIRSVDCEKTLLTLLNAGLIKQMGNIKQQGSPILYSITEECLYRFGVKSYEELMNIVKTTTA